VVIRVDPEDVAGFLGHRNTCGRKALSNAAVVRHILWWD
jgi:hypothetical protein